MNPTDLHRKVLAGYITAARAAHDLKKSKHIVIVFDRERAFARRDGKLNLLEEEDFQWEMWLETARQYLVFNRHVPVEPPSYLVPARFFNEYKRINEIANKFALEDEENGHS